MYPPEESIYHGMNKALRAQNRAEAQRNGTTRAGLFFILGKL